MTRRLGDAQNPAARDGRHSQDVFEVGWEPAAFFNTDVLRLGYAYSFVRRDDMEFGLHAGLHVTDIVMGIRASLVPVTAETEEFAVAVRTAARRVIDHRPARNSALAVNNDSAQAAVSPDDRTGRYRGILDESTLGHGLLDIVAERSTRCRRRRNGAACYRYFTTVTGHVAR